MYEAEYVLYQERLRANAEERRKRRLVEDQEAAEWMRIRGQRTGGVPEAITQEQKDAEESAVLLRETYRLRFAELPGLVFRWQETLRGVLWRTTPSEFRYWNSIQTAEDLKKAIKEYKEDWDRSIGGGYYPGGAGRGYVLPTVPTDADGGVEGFTMSVMSELGETDSLLVATMESDEYAVPDARKHVRLL